MHQHACEMAQEPPRGDFFPRAAFPYRSPPVAVDFRVAAQWITHVTHQRLAQGNGMCDQISDVPDLAHLTEPLIRHR
jgi:hypothetical protein